MLNKNPSVEKIKEQLQLTYEAVNSVYPLEVDNCEFESKFDEDPKNRMPPLVLIHQQLKLEGTTKEMVWRFHQKLNPSTTYSYVKFYQHYNNWLNKQSPCLRKIYKVGKKLFINSVNTSIQVANPDTGELSKVTLFIATLASSNFTYVEAFHCNDADNAIMANVHALEFFGGVPEKIIICNQTCFGKNNRNFNENQKLFANHYNTKFETIKLHKRQSNLKSEPAIEEITHWLLTHNEYEEVYTLASLNNALVKISKKLNDFRFIKLPLGRYDWFIHQEKGSLTSLPESPYICYDYQTIRSGINNHFCYQKHYYSLPSFCQGTLLNLRATASSIEVFWGNGDFLVHHTRQYAEYGFSTNPDHMVSLYRSRCNDQVTEKLLRSSNKVGFATGMFIKEMLDSKPYPEHSYLPCLAIINLGQQYNPQLFELACATAILQKQVNLKFIEVFIENAPH
jgi:hypothetical protein